MYIRKSIYHWIVILAVGSFLQACGSSSSGSDGGGGGVGPFMFYLGTDDLMNLGTGSLHAVDPGDPTNPRTVTSANTQGASGLISMTIDFGMGTYSDYTSVGVIYADGGRIRKVSAAPADALAVTQVSSETQATVLCKTIETHFDFSDMNNTAFLYEMPGPDGNCSLIADNVWRMVRLGMNSSTAPIDAQPVVDSIWNPATGALVGWLVLSGSNLVKTDANFANPVNLVSGVTIVEFVTSSFFGKILYNIDGELRIFDTASQTLSASRHTLINYLQADTSSVDTYYFADGDTLYELASDGLSDATPLVNAVIPGGQGDIELDLTDSHLIYSYTDINTGAATIKGINTTTRNNIDLYTGANLELFFIFTNNELVFFDVTDASSNPSAGIVQDDATMIKTVTADQAWAGMAIRTSGVFSELYNGMHTAFLNSGYVDINTGFGGGTVTAYDASTGAAGLVMGTIPADIQVAFVNGVGNFMLGMGMSVVFNPGPVFSYDLLFADSQTAGSLTRVTNTTNVLEWPVF